MNMPNFIIAGAAKSGTTALANFLGQHPDIFLSTPKEPRYFVRSHIRSISKKDPMRTKIIQSSILTKSEYQAIFNEGQSFSYRGEASVHYLYNYNESIRRIKEEIGNIPIFIILRHPIERAFSNYNYNCGVERLSFEKAIKAESLRKKRGYNSFWYYLDMGLYYNQVKNYMNAFPKLKVIIFDDFKKDTEKVCQDCFKFLGLDDTFCPFTKTKVNETLIPQNKIVSVIMHGFLSKFIIKTFPSLSSKKIFKQFKKKYHKKPDGIHPKFRKTLLNYYKNDVSKLERLIGRGLSDWMI